MVTDNYLTHTLIGDPLGSAAVADLADLDPGKASKFIQIGMNDSLTSRVRDRGVTLLLVEHDVQAVMGLCDKITVLNFGQLLTEGGPEEIRSHPDVIEAYLGSAHDAA